MTQISKGSEKFRTLPLWQNTWPKEKYYEEGESPTVFIKNKKQTNLKKKQQQQKGQNLLSVMMLSDISMLAFDRSNHRNGMECSEWFHSKSITNRTQLLTGNPCVAGITGRRSLHVTECAKTANAGAQGHPDQRSSWCPGRCETGCQSLHFSLAEEPDGGSSRNTL